jgi:hypothetical protein
MRLAGKQDSNRLAQKLQTGVLRFEPGVARRVGHWTLEHVRAVCKPERKKKTEKPFFQRRPENYICYSLRESEYRPKRLKIIGSIAAGGSP